VKDNASSAIPSTKTVEVITNDLSSSPAARSPVLPSSTPAGVVAAVTAVTSSTTTSSTSTIAATSMSGTDHVVSRALEFVSGMSSTKRGSPFLTLCRCCLDLNSHICINRNIIVIDA
jgi:hypothetical protein